MRVVLCLIALLLSGVASATDRSVLIVHSYHLGFFWTDAFQHGVDDVLTPHTDIKTRAVYLDTKRLQSALYFDQIYQLYKTLLEQERYDAVLVSDNNALSLMQRLAPQLGDTPVIFGGINNYSREMHRDLRATGVTEDIDIESNIALIRRLQPNVERIYVVTDFSRTGAAVRQQLNHFTARSPQYQSLIQPLVPDTFEHLYQRAAGMNRNDAILYWVYYRDQQGEVSDLVQWNTFIHHAQAPVYVVHDLGIGNGAIGGVVLSGHSQGKAAADTLLEVLANPSAPLPKVKRVPPEIKLDYQAVTRWGLGIEGEPAGVFFNKPLPFAERYQRELELLVMTVLVLSLILLSLIYYTRRLKKSEQIARHSQVLLESVFDQSYHYIGMLDQHGRIVSSNSKLQELLYNPQYQLDKPLWQHKHLEAGSAQRIKHYFAAQQASRPAQFEVEVWHPEHGVQILELSLKPLPKDVGQQVRFLLEARDITSRKQTEDKLMQREASLSHYYDQQPVMMLTLNEQNRIQQVNRFTEQMLGYEEQQLLGHRLREFYLHADAIVPRQVLLQPKQVAKGVWQREIEYRHADGHAMWVRENIRPLAETGHLLIVGEDVTETRKLADQLAYQARYDLLTDTYNRNQFELELDKALSEVESHLRTHAMLYLDLDQLKVLNDTAGHEAGDAAIKFCASMLQEILPYNTILARMGGDEFALLLKDCTERDAVHVARSIISTLAEQAFIWNDIRLNLTCSIGIRLIDHTATSPQMVHAQADTACHAAKEEGRNRFNLYCQDDQDLRRRELEMESVSLVHDALANQRIELFGQRILNVSQPADSLYCEVLVRIRNSDGEYISPAIFMPASERYNIAHLIDKVVVSQSLAYFTSHPDALARLDLVSINLSGHSMGNREFVQFLLQALASSPVPCGKICLEITETAAMSNMEQAISLFSQLKQLGCLIALDDFGSGLSSFGYLKRLPVDIVKIDGLFVRDIDHNEMDRLMVRSINDLAQQMGKRTVAEFVENRAIYEHLVALGVDYAQGYLIGRPKPLAELMSELMGEGGLDFA